MNYYIIEKIECLEGEVTRSPIGYTMDESKAELANATSADYHSWISENIKDLESQTITVSDYFNNNPSCYACGWTTKLLGKCGIPEITDYTFLEGV